MKAWLSLFVMCFIAFPLQGIAQVAVPDSQDRSFTKFREQVARDFEGKPVKGSHKRAKRALHYWERRLDSEGKMFNHVRANMEALEQLYIDTFPALIQGDWQHVGPLTTLGTDFNQEGVGRINQIHFASGNRSIW